MMEDRPVGDLLREWRHRRGLSQLDLAIQADVSARHVSFVETGRTIPSSAMVLRLAEHLGVPLRERNRLLVAAGHAPVVRERPLEDPDLASARDALEQILRGHEPYPALAVDRRWNLLSANAAIDVFLEDVEPSLLEPPVNMMRLGLHPDGFAPRLRNLDQVRAHLLPRLARQVAGSGDPELSALYEELLSYGPEDDPPPPDPADIALPLRIRHRGAELCFINTVTTFGAAFDVTLEEIAVEAYFPADDATARFFREGA
ncbi:helix-turn-helix transcriptional regulator [Actinomadura kijaniata]|uniref:Transcriptional regulator with XRE-family HTH domain n=1 Tax=Actinomadura namibiensis TaxID=182080 RepID=A0A7W3LLM7_ACTNM|nr:helix-turn-helix transcriptional regulator [Actinomadura namibiensis]MBA8950433.1 transcriptional regulator with XRE-family HTH domain [Actinomadura namibiensis]